MTYSQLYYVYYNTIIYNKNIIFGQKIYYLLTIIKVLINYCLIFKKYFNIILP